MAEFALGEDSALFPLLKKTSVNEVPALLEDGMLDEDVFEMLDEVTNLPLLDDGNLEDVFTSPPSKMHHITLNPNEGLDSPMAANDDMESFFEWAPV